jgi:tryptophan-rich sensory protein
MSFASILALLVFVALCAAAAAIGAATRPGEWYRQLVRPAWAPPAWLFAPVWTLLYLMIAVAGWLVWLRWDWEGAPLALALWAVQLVLNATWTPLFFGLRRAGLGFANIFLLWLAIIATISAFERVSLVAALLLLPYLLWVTFASALNFSVWQLNRAPARR